MHTYFIHSPKLEAVKIGRSVKPLKRLQAIKNGNPDELKILGIVDGDRESEFHERFAEYRTRGEWFSLGPELMDFLKAEFKCVLKTKKRPLTERRQPTETWNSIIDRAEENLGCGLRHGEWGDFYETMINEVYGYLEAYWDEVAKEDQLSKDDQFEMWEEDTKAAYDMLYLLEDWWSWVKGWNIKADGGWLDTFLLFQRPSLARDRERLLLSLADCGCFSEYDPTDFIRLNIVFCWRERHEDELVGQIQGPVILDDASALYEIYGRANLIPIALDESFDFKILGDAWYRERRLPTPAEAMRDNGQVDGAPDNLYIEPNDDGETVKSDSGEVGVDASEDGGAARDDGKFGGPDGTGGDDHNANGGTIDPLCGEGDER